MREGYVVVRDFVEELNLGLVQEQRCGDGVDWRVTPALVEEAAIFVELIEVVEVGL